MTDRIDDTPAPNAEFREAIAKDYEWGFSSDISMQRSDQATVVDGANTYHLFQQNLIAYLIEFEAGWWIDPTAFTAFDDAVA